MSALTFLQPIRVRGGHRPATPQEIVSQIFTPIIQRVVLFTGYRYKDLRDTGRKDPDLITVRWALVYVLSSTGVTFQMIANALDRSIDTIIWQNNEAKKLYEKSAEFRDRCHAYAGLSEIPSIPEIL